MRHRVARVLEILPLALLLWSVPDRAAAAEERQSECVWGNCQDGRGTLRHPDGAMETGIFQGGRLVLSKGRAEPVEREDEAPRERTDPSTPRANPRSRVEGCLRGDCISGPGVRAYRNGSNYEGTFENGLRQGQGVQTWPDGRRYEGGWLADRRHGRGVQIYRDGRYVGVFAKGSPTRDGVRSYENGDRYVGDFARERRHGHGSLRLSNGDHYTGEFEDDQPHGRGVYTERSGAVREGRFAGGQYLGAEGAAVVPGLVAGGRGCVGGNCWNGTGRFIREDGSEFVGGFREGRPHGQGSVTHPDGRVESGHWENGAPAGRRVIATPGAVASWRAKSAAQAGCLSGDCVNGSGTYRWADGSRYTGGFHESRPHGQGRWEHPDGTRYAGSWSHGTRDGRGQETSSTGAVRSGVWTRGQLQTSGLASPDESPSPARIRWPDLSRAPAPRAAEAAGGDAAVIVGIERYAHVAPIAGASDNATAWYEYLVRSRGLAPARAILLLDDDATREDLAWAIDEAARQVSPEGTLWFVFVGHGAPAKGGDDGLLVGFDAQPKARSLSDRSLRRSELLAGLEASPARRIHVLLDASFSGRDAEGQPLVPGLQPLVVSLEGESGDPRVAFFNAARDDELASRLPGADRPAFSYLALGALRGWGDENRDGEITAGELHGYVERTLAAVLRDRRQRNGFSGAPHVSLGRSGGERGPDLSSVRAERAKSRSEDAGPAAR